ncbi:hypothetical protein ACOMHN_023143 [Nucella lapillus]
MSFLGSIGRLMSGSGLREVLEIVHASNSVGHLLTGKAVARALRGHFLVDAALHAIITAKAISLPVQGPVTANHPTDDLPADDQMISIDMSDSSEKEIKDCQADGHIIPDDFSEALKYFDNSLKGNNPGSMCVSKDWIM